MTKFPPMLFDEPDSDPNTLNNLGPLQALAGRWEGTVSRDVKPTAEGDAPQRYVEHSDIRRIDPQTNGP